MRVLHLELYLLGPSQKYWGFWTEGVQIILLSRGKNSCHHCCLCKTTDTKKELNIYMVPTSLP